jgi:hypothetical protein
MISKLLVVVSSHLFIQLQKKGYLSGIEPKHKHHRFTRDNCCACTEDCPILKELNPQIQQINVTRLSLQILWKLFIATILQVSGQTAFRAL